MSEKTVHIIMPVKDAMEMAERAIRAAVSSGYNVHVYDDYSLPDTAAQLDELSRETGIEVIHLSEKTGHPSPNYRWVLIDAQRKCIQKGSHLVIIESDVIINHSTIATLLSGITPGTGMVAAVTTDEQGVINFPYDYAKGRTQDGVCKKRFSFCCTLLTNELLQAYDFELLDPEKNWYDVPISRMSRQLGMDNILQVCNPVVHIPHSSRPWKQLKYTNPLLYYWRKFTQHRDKI